MVIGIVNVNPWLILESILIFSCIVFNFSLSVGDLYLKKVEMLGRLRKAVRNLEENLANGLTWIPENYPHLHTPLSASVVLQWTIRDGQKVNLPWQVQNPRNRREIMNLFLTATAKPQSIIKFENCSCSAAVCDFSNSWKSMNSIRELWKSMNLSHNSCKSMNSIQGLFVQI